MTDAVSLGNKVQPFWSPTNLTQAQVEKILATQTVTATLPDGKAKELPLAGLFQVAPLSEKGQAGMLFTPDVEQTRKLCVTWCQSLSRLSPKSLPRSQRPMVHILKKLTPEPTGVPAIDKGRNMLLDGVFERSLWFPVTGTLVQKIEPAKPAA